MPSEEEEEEKEEEENHFHILAHVFFTGFSFPTSLKLFPFSFVWGT